MEKSIDTPNPVNPHLNPDLSTDLHQVHMGSVPNIEDRPVECRVPSVSPFSISAWQCLLEAGHKARELRESSLKASFPCWVQINYCKGKIRAEKIRNFSTHRTPGTELESKVSSPVVQKAAILVLKKK